MLKSIKAKKKEQKVDLRVSAYEAQKIQEKANKYTEGNVSEWVRYAAITHEPPKTEQ